MATENIERRARELYDGKIDFAGYAGRTKTEYERMAAMLLRRWAPPAWVAQEDVVQDLFTGTWERLYHYEAGLGPSLGDFVVYQSISRAKRLLHSARGAILHGSPDRNPSRFDRPMSSLGRRSSEEGRPETLDEMLSRLTRRLDDGWDEGPEARAIAREEGESFVRVIVASCRNPVERRVIAGVVERGGTREVAEELCRDEMFRASFGVDDPEVMGALVESFVDDVVSRAEHGMSMMRAARAGSGTEA